MRMKIILIAVALSFGLTRVEAQATKPATQPVDPKIKSLIRQLDNDDSHKRDAAADALRKLGKDAIPGLQAALKDDSPQVRLTAEALIAEQHEKEHPTPRQAKADPQLPEGIILNGGGLVLNGVRINNMGGQVQIRMNAVANGRHVRDMTIDENGHRTHIHEDNDGVKVEVTDNGETKTYVAKSAAELKEKEPEGYKVYEKYMSGGGVGNVKIEIAPK
jgi:hypothetical protein